MKYIINITILAIIAVILFKTEFVDISEYDFINFYNWKFITLVFFFGGLSQYLMFLRWFRFVRFVGVDVPKDILIYWHFKGILIGYFILGFIATDMSRTFDIGSSDNRSKIKESIIRPAQATLLDRLVSLTSLVLTSILALTLLTKQINLLTILVSSLIALCVSGFIIVLFYKFLKQKKYQFYLLNLLKLLKDRLHEATKSGFLWWQLALSIFANLAMGVSFFLLVGADLDFFAYTVSVLSVSNLSAVVPISPSGLGFGEGISEYLLRSKLITTGAEALILMRLLNLILTTGFLVFSVVQHKVKK